MDDLLLTLQHFLDAAGFPAVRTHWPDAGLRVTTWPPTERALYLSKSNLTIALDSGWHGCCRFDLRQAQALPDLLAALAHLREKDRAETERIDVVLERTAARLKSLLGSATRGDPTL